MSSNFSYWSDFNYLESMFGPLQNLPKSVNTINFELTQSKAEAEGLPSVQQENKITERAIAALPKQKKYEKKEDPVVVVVTPVKPANEATFRSRTPKKKIDHYRVKQPNPVMAPPPSQSCEEKPQLIKGLHKNSVVNFVAKDVLNQRTNKKIGHLPKNPPIKDNTTDAKTDEFTKNSPPFKKTEVKAELKVEVEIKEERKSKDASIVSNLQICLKDEVTQVPKIIALDPFEPHAFSREEIILFYLSQDFESALRQVDDKRRIQVYRQLIQVCVSGLIPEKNRKVLPATLDRASNILSKHQRLVKNELINAKEPVIYQLLYPLVEMCMKSQSLEACLTGLMFLQLFFTQKFEMQNRKEILLAEHFLIHHTKALQKNICNRNATKNDCSDSLINRLRNGTTGLLTALLENGAEIKYFELAESCGDNADTELSIKFMLKWLEKLYGQKQNGLMPQHQLGCDYLVKMIQKCKSKELRLIFDYFHQLPQEKINFNIPSTLIQRIYSHLYNRKFELEHPLENPSLLLYEFSQDLWKLTPETISEIFPALNVFLTAIGEHNRQLSFICHQYLLKAISTQVGTQTLKLRKQTIHERDESIETLSNHLKVLSNNLKGKNRNAKAIKKALSPPDPASVDHQDIHHKTVSNLFNSVFRSTMKTLSTDEIAKKEEMEGLWKIACEMKKHFDFKLKLSTFLPVYTLCCCKATSYDESLATEIILEYLQDVPIPSILFEQLPHNKSFVNLLQKCVTHGVNCFFLMKSEEGKILFKNLLALTKLILEAEVEPEDKRIAIGGLLCILASAEHRMEFASEIYPLFKKAEPFYEKADFIYWIHYYKLGKFEGKEPPTALQNTKEQLKIRRQALTKLTTLLLSQDSLVALDQLFGILLGSDTIEFKGHFVELAVLYDSLLDYIGSQIKITITDPDQNKIFHRSLAQAISLWIGGQKLKKYSVFSRVDLQTEKRVYLDALEQQAHRKLMLKMILIHESACRICLDEDLDLHRKFGDALLNNVKFLAEIKAFDIFSEEDLESFKQILDVVCKFVSDQKSGIFSDKLLRSFYATVQKVFAHSAVKGETLESYQTEYEREWKRLISKNMN